MHSSRTHSSIPNPLKTHIHNSVSWYLVLIVSVVLTFVPSITSAQDGSRTAPGLSLRSGETVTVIGITQGKHQIRKKARKRLQDRRIGFGLTTLLAEVLFDTGNFRLQEAKGIQQHELFEDFVSRYWIEPRQQYTEGSLPSLRPGSTAYK